MVEEDKRIAKDFMARNAEFKAISAKEKAGLIAKAMVRSEKFKTLTGGKDIDYSRLQKQWDGLKALFTPYTAPAAFDAFKMKK